MSPTMLVEKLIVVNDLASVLDAVVAKTRRPVYEARAPPWLSPDAERRRPE